MFPCVYSLTKKETVEKIKTLANAIPDDCKILKMNLKIINEENFGKNDIKTKKELSREYKNMLSLWVALEKEIYTIDKPSNFKNEQKEEIKDFCKTTITVDLNKM